MIVALVGAACGDDDGDSVADPDADDDAAAQDDDGGATESASLTVAIPFPSALAFPDLYLAQAQGYLADENLDVQIEPLDGSGAAVQAVVTGSADAALAAPAPIMQAVEQDAEITSIFTSYQTGIFTLVTTPDSGVEDLSDLEGETVGVGALDGGEVPIVKAMLSDAGLKEGTDYEMLAVGDAGTALTALRRGDVKAYGAAFIDVLIMEDSGQETVDLTPEGFVAGTDVHAVVGNEMIDDGDVAERFARALARGAAWLQTEPDAALDVICEEVPEECEDRDFARVILDAVIELEELPEAADGQYGYTDPEVMQAYADILADEGELEEDVDVEEVFSNEFIEAANEFDEAEL